MLAMVAFCATLPCRRLCQCNIHIARAILGEILDLVPWSNERSLSFSVLGGSFLMLLLVEG
jgi:hypothetical protein